MRYINFLHLIILLSLFTPDKLFSQDAERDPAVIGIQGGLYHDIGGYKEDLLENIIACFASAYIRMHHHEISAGLSFPAYYPYVSGYYYLHQFRIGASAGYKFYLLNPVSRANIFVKYEFQYIYFDGNYKEDYKDHSTVYHVTNNFIRNVIGVGLCAYFDQKHNVGIVYSIGYLIPFNYYTETTETSVHKDSKRWGDPHTKNYFNFMLALNVKLAALTKKKN